jgi:RHS repeat-associated protein
VLACYTYGYDAAGQLTSYQDSSSSLTYGYDNSGELTSATGTLNGSSYSVSYGYDLNGNRNTTGYTTGTGNELTGDGTYSYTYDNEGNLTTQVTIATGSVTYYSYDYRNRLTEVKQETSGGTVINDEKFTYDVNDNRIGVSLNGTQQSWTTFDGANPYIDFSGGGSVTERYLADPRGLNEFYGQVNSGGTPQWLLTDNLGSVRQVVNTSGTVLDQLTYDPFGGLVSETNATNGDRFKYAGGAYDSITGQYQFGARYYGPSDGRFESQDPLGFAAGDTDLYRYVFNGPTDVVDPTGLEPPIYHYPYGSPKIGYGAYGGGPGALGYNPFGTPLPGLTRPSPSYLPVRGPSAWYCGSPAPIGAPWQGYYPPPAPWTPTQVEPLPPKADLPREPKFAINQDPTTCEAALAALREVVIVGRDVIEEAIGDDIRPTVIRGTRGGRGIEVPNWRAISDGLRRVRDDTTKPIRQELRRLAQGLLDAIRRLRRLVQLLCGSTVPLPE